MIRNLQNIKTTKQNGKYLWLSNYLFFCFFPEFPIEACNWIPVSVQFSSAQSLSRVRLFVTPWIAAHQAPLSITNSWSSLRLPSIESVMPYSHLILCRPLFLLPQIPPSIKAFTVSQLFTWGDQSTGISALASFFPKNTQGWSPLEWPFRYDLNQIPYD